MKKFLFTLAALLMAGVVSAETYFYIPDVELTEEQLNQPVLVDVMCHIDVAFNAYGCELVYSDNLVADPEDDGFVTDESNGLSVSYQNNKGTTKTLNTEANLAGDVYAFMGFTGATYGYWNPDGNGWVQYGAVKWEPADEDLLFFQIYVKPVVDGAKANFDGTITLTSNFSSGNDARADVIPMAGPEYNSEAHVCHITFTQQTPPEPEKTPFVATAVIGDAEGYNVPLHYEANDPAAVVTVTVNEQPVTVTWDNEGNATLVLGQTPDYGVYNIVLNVAVGDTEHFEGEAVKAEKQVEIAQPSSPEPTVAFNTQEDGSVTVVVTNATEYVIYVDGQVWTGGDNIPQTYAEQTIKVVATNELPGYKPTTATVETTIPAKAKEEVNAPTIKETVGETAVTVTVTPDPNTDGQLVYNGDYSYVRGDEDYYVTVTAYTTEGPTCQASAVTTYTFLVPKKVPTSIDELINGQNVAGVRYFNMAGQEMSQANGMTIVVVTYTDGTTSTVKVMK
ncbi:MAG: hypothetical protein IJK93_04890 [Muribaculaceae bacterium]|nr:hypothetical protein [Muribaculaceae bacterium]